MKKRKFFVLLLIACLFFITLNFVIGSGFAQLRAELAFNLFRENFEQAAQGRDVKPFGVQNVTRYEPQEYLAANEQTSFIKEGVEFQTSSWGFASQTSYFGIVYTAEDLPLGFQCVDLPLISDGDSWYWHEDQVDGYGDNWQRITKLDDCWYYYEMHF